MSPVAYLRSAVLLPIVLPILLVGFKLALWLAGLMLPATVDGFVSLPVAALLVFGPLYVLVAGALLVALRHGSVTAHIVAALAAPLLMALLMPPFLWLVGLRGPELASSWREFGVMCLWVGYAYVAVVLAGLALADQIGWVRRRLA
ncbi:MAG: hypothetical protein KJ061_12340 [Vicinamibacteraceae bacterium]|nr:hypothetical protein [Vicinamibacteraceae bacterium]